MKFRSCRATVKQIAEPDTWNEKREPSRYGVSLNEIKYKCIALIMKRFFLFLFFPLAINAQFVPAAGQPGSTAIKKDSSIIINWASACIVNRGLQDISNPGLGYVSVGDGTSAVGPADVTNVVSLGDRGTAILTFPQAIKNGSGFDFCVFENSFDPGFLELAFVEVSSDGVNFTRFPAVSNTQNTLQIGPFDTSNEAVKLNNLAGKYIGGYGVPFDLQELSGTPGLDLEHITHVKIIDVVGCIQPAYASYDSNNKIINDLWSTPFPSGGFDLDAVGVINQAPVGIDEEKQEQLMLYYANEKVFLKTLNIENKTCTVFDLSGKFVKAFDSDKKLIELDLSDLEKGIYLLEVKNDKRTSHMKLMR